MSVYSAVYDGSNENLVPSFAAQSEIRRRVLCSNPSVKSDRFARAFLASTGSTIQWS